MKKLFSILLSCLWMLHSTAPVSAQDCFGVQIKEGGGFEMASFDGKGKSTGTLKYKFAKVTQEGGFTVVDIVVEGFSPKGKSEYTQKFTMKCDGNESFIDATSLVMEDQMKSFESFNMKFTSNDIFYPNRLSVGETLKEASLKGTGDMSGIPITFDMIITDRKVAAQEKLKVGAGEFDAYKITATSKMTTKTIANISMEFEIVSYRAPGVIWDIKTETYRKGKLISTSELSKIY